MLQNCLFESNPVINRHKIINGEYGNVYPKYTRNVL